MVFMKEELVASLTDIAAIVIQCSRCKSQVKIPIDATIGDSGDLRVLPLTQCPVCLSNFDSTLRDYVKAFIGNLSAHKGTEKISLLLNRD